MAAEWYQTDTDVTASVSIKRISRDDPITADFREQHCAIMIGGKVYWETPLANSIVPDKCGVKIGRVRVELKMKKTCSIRWSDFEALKSPTTNCNEPTQNHVPTSTIPHDQCLSSEATNIHSLPQPSSTTPSSSSSSSKPTARKQFNKSVQNDFVYLNHLQHDWMDTGDSEVRVKVMVADVKREMSTVDFKEGRIEILFQTLNETFLNSYTGSSQTTFIWKIHLYGTIRPEECNYNITPQAIVISLKKLNVVKWKSLERSKHQPSLSNTSKTGFSNHVEGGQIQNLDSNSNNLEMNSFDDVMTTPPSVPTQSSGAGMSGQSSGCHGNKCMQAPSNEPATQHTHPPQQEGEPMQNFHTNPIYRSPPTNTTNVSSHHLPPRSQAAQLEMSDPSYRDKQLGQPSKTGLSNLGNTCFMNSILQCLSNTPELRDYFISGRYLANINTDNPLGFQGKLAKCFCGILRKLWSGEYDFFSPKRLLEIVANRSKYFDGNSQHDTHEFMSYLLDGLHEDLNQVQTKPVTKPVEMDDCTDREVATESWRVHKLRNDSVMVDLFQGQFKSTLVCQECNKESVTFDPFQSLSVPIPRNLRRLPVIFVPQDPDSIPQQLILQLPPEATLKLLKASVARRMSLSMSQLRVFEVYKGKFQSLMSDNSHPISGIKSSDIIIVSEVLLKRKCEDLVMEINVVQRVHNAPLPTKCGWCECGEEGGKTLQRCSKCKTVSYCHRTCQQKDWGDHRRKCGKINVFPIGLPFVISLPTSQLTYSRLTDYAEKFARRSVIVTRRKPLVNQRHVGSSIQESTESIQTSDEGIQMCTDSIQTSEESIQESTENIQISDGEMETDSLQRFTDNLKSSKKSIQESTESIQESTESIQESTESIQESAKNIQESPLYRLVRVNRFVEPVPGAQPLEDKGDHPLQFHDSTVYLAMDWNDDQENVVVTPKPSMDYVEDEKAESLLKTSDTVSLTDCLQLFTEPETLSQKEAWYCPRCKEHRPAIKQMSIWRLPRFLIIHLKRFSFHNFVWRSKIDHFISFPLRGLDMSPYLLGDAANDISPETPPIYDLYGTVNHYGNVYIGHYVATVKPPLSETKEWLCYDDHKVWNISEEKVPCSEAYVLFYCRRDTAASP